MRPASYRSAALLVHRLARWSKQALGRSDQCHDLACTLLYNGVRACTLGLQSKSLGKARQQNNGDAQFTFTQALNKLQSIHRRHAVVGDDQIESLLFGKRQRISTAMRRHNPVPQLLQNRATSEDSIVIIIDEED